MYELNAPRPAPRSVGTYEIHRYIHSECSAAYLLHSLSVSLSVFYIHPVSALRFLQYVNITKNTHIIPYRLE